MPYLQEADKSKLANFHPINLFSIISKVREGKINSSFKRHLLIQPAHRRSAWVPPKSLSSWHHNSLGANIEKRAELHRWREINCPWHQGSIKDFPLVGIIFSTTNGCVFGGQSSQPHNVFAGIPQSCVSGSSMCNCFVNYFSSIVRSKLGIFAQCSASFATPQLMKQSTTKCSKTWGNIKAWADRWQVTFAPHK